MILRTVRFRGIASVDRVSTLQVFATGHSLKVVGIHASTIAAQMIQLEARRDLPDEEFIRESVREQVLTGNFQVSISGWCVVTEEFPAPIPDQQLSEETLLYTHHVDPPVQGRPRPGAFARRPVSAHMIGD